MQNMPKCPNSKTELMATQKKIQTKNHNNSPSSLCKVKWYYYLVLFFTNNGHKATYAETCPVFGLLCTSLSHTLVTYI